MKPKKRTGLRIVILGLAFLMVASPFIAAWTASHQDPESVVATAGGVGDLPWEPIDDLEVSRVKVPGGWLIGLPGDERVLFAEDASHAWSPAGTRWEKVSEPADLAALHAERARLPGGWLIRGDGVPLGYLPDADHDGTRDR